MNHVYREELTPLLFLRRALHVFGDRTAVVDGERTLTYAELHDRALRLASALAARGVAPGDRVAILAPNVPELLEAHFGVPAAHAILCALNTRLAPAEVAYILGHSGARVLIVDPSLRELADQALGQNGADAPLVVEIGHEYEAFLAHAPGGNVPSELDDEERPISLNYTSGTTGRPKGVLYTHRTAYLNALGEVIEAGLTADSRYLWTLPMFHCNGWCFPWAVVAVGGLQICLRRVEAAEIWRHLRAGATHLCGAPIVLATIARHEGAAPLDHPFTVVTAAAPPSPATLARMEALGARIVHVYGLTETYGPFTVCEWRGEWNELPDEERHRRRARQGVPYVFGGRLRVLDADGGDVPADGATPGEVAMRGTGVMAGYFRDPQATAEAFRGGWFHSGDLAVMHPDGYIEIRDRLKDVVISGGENISTVEVEQALCAHPAVVEAAVIGVPDERYGERPKGFVTLAEGAQLDETELIAFCRERIAHYKCPDRIEFGPLPKTSTGKTQKFVLREREWAGLERRVN